jgi:hypothetical protein
MTARRIMRLTERRQPHRRRNGTSTAADCRDIDNNLKYWRTIMRKHEQHTANAEKPATKEDGCCGGAQDHECAKPETNAVEMDKKPSMSSQVTHTHSAHAARDSCGCGGRHK